MLRPRETPAPFPASCIEPATVGRGVRMLRPRYFSSNLRFNDEESRFERLFREECSHAAPGTLRISSVSSNEPDLLSQKVYRGHEQTADSSLPECGILPATCLARTWLSWDNLTDVLSNGRIVMNHVCLFSSLLYLKPLQVFRATHDRHSSRAPRAGEVTLPAWPRTPAEIYLTGPDLRACGGPRHVSPPL